jgi:hypothetical protein
MFEFLKKLSKPEIKIPDLPRMKPASASEIAESFKLQPQAQQLLSPSLTPTQYVQALQENQLSTDSINFLAHGMPERESVFWASESTKMVGDTLGASDMAALEAADAWVSNPCEATSQAAAEAVAGADFSSPATWAAQAAAWAGGPADATAAAGIPAPAGLTGHAASGAVLLAAARSAGQVPQVPSLPGMEVPGLQAPSINLPQLTAPSLPTFTAPEIPSLEVPALEMTPAQLQEVAQIHQPFIDLGIEIASGSKPVV